MADTDPVEWAALDRVGATTSRWPALFDAHRDEVPADATLEEAVATLYAAWHRDHEADAPEQGAVYVFAYLAEREGLAAPADDLAGVPASLVERRPDDETLERLFWEAEQVPWWIAARLGVHYSLVQLWLREAEVPLMRRNVVPDTLAAVDALDDDAD